MKRPLGIAIMAILMCIVGVINLISAWVLFYLLLPFFTLSGIGLMILTLGFGASFIVTAAGLWVGKRWAWLLGLISSSLQLILSAYTIISSSLSPIWMTWHMSAISISILAVVYLSSTIPKRSGEWR